MTENCWTCDGDGMVRNNSCAGGRYIFSKIECPDCRGTGYLEYEKCPDCLNVYPVGYLSEHDCGD